MIQRVLHAYMNAMKNAIDVANRGLRTLLEAIFTLLRSSAGSYGSFLGAMADSLSKLLFMEVRLQAPRRDDTLETRLDEIAKELRKSGGRAQKLIDDAEALIGDRVRQVEYAKARVLELEAEVELTQTRLDHLSQIQPEAAEAIKFVLGEDLDQREKRSGRRDLVLFVMGILVSIVVGLAFQLVFG